MDAKSYRRLLCDGDIIARWGAEIERTANKEIINFYKRKGVTYVPIMDNTKVKIKATCPTVYYDLRKKECVISAPEGRWVNAPLYEVACNPEIPLSKYKNISHLHGKIKKMAKSAANGIVSFDRKTIKHLGKKCKNNKVKVYANGPLKVLVANDFGNDCIGFALFRQIAMVRGECEEKFVTVKI